MRKTSLILLATALVLTACSRTTVSGTDGPPTVEGFFSAFATERCTFEDLSEAHVNGCNLEGPFDTEAEELQAVVACYAGLRDVISGHMIGLGALEAPDEVATDFEAAVTSGGELVGDFDALVVELQAATTLVELEERFANFTPPSGDANDRFSQWVGTLEDYAITNGIEADFACAGGDPILGARVQVAGQPLGPVGTNPDTSIGAPAPVITGKDFAGNVVTVGGGSGTPTAILLIAHWCGHCQNEVPAVQDWIDANGMPANLDLVSIITFNDAARDNYPPDSWLSGEGWTVPVIIDDARSSAMGALGGTAVPYWVILDGDGNVYDRFTGTATIDEVLSRAPNG